MDPRRLPQKEGDFEKMRDGTFKREPKAYKVPSQFTMGKIVQYMWHDLDMKSHLMILRKEEADPNEYIELLMETK